MTRQTSGIDEKVQKWVQKHKGLLVNTKVEPPISGVNIDYLIEGIKRLLI